MAQPSTATIESLLVANLTREVVMGVEDALEAGARRAFSAASGMDEGHLPHVVGQLRLSHERGLSSRPSGQSGFAFGNQGQRTRHGPIGDVDTARFNVPRMLLDQWAAQSHATSDGARKCGP